MNPLKLRLHLIITEHIHYLHLHSEHKKTMLKNAGPMLTLSYTDIYYNMLNNSG